MYLSISNTLNKNLIMNFKLPNQNYTLPCKVKYLRPKKIQHDLTYLYCLNQRYQKILPNFLPKFFQFRNLIKKKLQIMISSQIPGYMMAMCPFPLRLLYLLWATGNEIVEHILDQKVYWDAPGRPSVRLSLANFTCK